MDYMDGCCADYSSNAAVCGAHAGHRRFISKVLWVTQPNKFCEFMKHESSLRHYSIYQYEDYKLDTTLRQKMIDGEVDAGCAYCIAREKTGINRREHHSRLFKEEYETFSKDTFDIGHLELRLGNLCNLKCTMCGPYASTTWSSEIKKNFIPFLKFGIEDVDNHYNWINDENLIALVKDILKNCISVNFGGGEPLMHPRINEFLLEVDKNAELSFNTNGTKLDNTTLELLENRPNLKIVISVDGVGKHNDYIRSGSKWNDIENNINKLKQRNIPISFYYILQHTSLFTFAPLYQYCIENNIDLGIGEIYSESVDGSGHLTLASADADDVARFQDWLAKINSHKLDTVKNWIKNYKYDHELNLRFRQYFEMLDSIRSTNFNETFR
jgi:sulfatase maturation enzyme AslB (radical SAM superfamily)